MRYTYENRTIPGTTFTAEDVIRNARVCDVWMIGKYETLDEARAEFEASKDKADAYEEKAPSGFAEYHFAFVELTSEDEDGEFEILDEYAVGINEV